MHRKQTFRPKSKNGAAGKADNDARDQTKTKPPHLPEVVPCGAANDLPGLLIGLDYQPPIAREVGCAQPPWVDPV
jgi:hypothetical protein